MGERKCKRRKQPAHEGGTTKQAARRAEERKRLSRRLLGAAKNTQGELAQCSFHVLGPLLSIAVVYRILR